MLSIMMPSQYQPALSFDSLFSFVSHFNQHLPNRRGRDCLEGGQTYSGLTSATAPGAEKFFALKLKVGLLGSSVSIKDGDWGWWFFNTSYRYNWVWRFLGNHLSSGAREPSHRHHSSCCNRGGQEMRIQAALRTTGGGAFATSYIQSCVGRKALQSSMSMVGCWQQDPIFTPDIY